MQIFHRITVAHHIALESQIIPETIREPILAALNRDAVVVVVGTHHSQQAGPSYHFTPRVYMYVFHFVGSHLRIHPRHTFAPTLVVGVCDEMLACGSHLVIRLHTGSHLHSKFRHQIRGLSIDFFITSPSLVSAHIQNRGIDIGISQQPCLPAGNPADLVHQFLVPSVSYAQLSGEICRAICLDTADSLIGEIHGNPQTGFLYKETLHDIERLRVFRSRP